MPLTTNPQNIQQALARAVAASDKIRNSINTIYDPNASPLSIAQAKTNLASSVLSLVQVASDLGLIELNPLVGVFSQNFNQYGLGVPIGQFSAAVASNDTDKMITTGLGLASSVCSVLTILPDLCAARTAWYAGGHGVVRCMPALGG